MLISPLLQFVTSLLNGLYSALPPWHLTIGAGCFDGTCDQATDNNALHYTLLALYPINKVLPLSDCIMPMMAFFMVWAVATAVYKGVTTILNYVRGAGA